ncbi:hypothetical protein DV738_g3039, partial [Chaetothyriales sp. CBS 135597]
MFSATARRAAAPGFWQKTSQRFQEQARVAINLEGISMPLRPYPILDFADPQTATWMKTLTDKQIGGSSTAEITQVAALPANRPEVSRTGYAAWRNEDRGLSLFGDLYWDIDSYTYLALRVKSDGRRYFVNLKTESLVPSDIHQHRLYTARHRGADGPADPGRWETVLIKIREFVRTSHGAITEPQSEIRKQKIKSVGLGLIDRVPGPFEIAVGAIWATNLNERGQVDGEIGWEESDQGSARLHNVTEEMLRQREEEKRIRQMTPKESFFGRAAR